MSRSFLGMLHLLVSVFATGVAEPLDFYRSSLAHTGYFPDEKVSPAPKVIGKYGLINVGIHTASKSSPTVADGVIYVGADSGVLYALDAETLTVRWQFRVRPAAKFGIHGTPAVDEKRVYIGAYDGWLYALEKKNGRLVWQSKLGDYIGSSPTIWEDKIYIGVETKKPNGYMSCVLRETGKEVYRTSVFGDHTHSTPTINPQTRTIFVGANSDKAYAIDADTGIIRWYFTSERDIKSTPAIFENRVLITSWDGHLYCLEQTTGKLDWAFKAGAKSMSSPAIDTDDRTVFFGSHDGSMYAVDFDSGELVWRFRTARRITGSASIVRRADGDGKLCVFGSVDGNLYGLNTKDGKELFKIETQGKVTSVPTIQNGTIYVSGDDGFLYVLR